MSLATRAAASLKAVITPGNTPEGRQQTAFDAFSDELTARVHALGIDLHTDPRMVPAASLLKELTSGLARLEKQKLLLSLERELKDKPLDRRSGTSMSLHGTLLKLRAELMSESPVPAAPGGSDDGSITAALDILHGKPLPQSSDHQTQVRELDRKADALRIAISKQNAICDEIKSALTYEFQKKLLPEWKTKHVELFRTMRKAAAIYAEIGMMKAAIAHAGMEFYSHVLPLPNLRTPTMLGSETKWDSEISGWRRVLEEAGWIE